MSSTDEVSGCPACLPPDADDAWEAMLSLTIEARLIDESHFIVLLRRCPNCNQGFVSVFCERIDWADGQDPQFWCLLPISAEEAQRLSDAGRGLVTRLAGLAPDRRSLCHDSPKGADPRSFWSRGVTIRPHD